MSVKQKNIRAFELEELIPIMQEIGEKSYRAKQVYEWLWEKNATSFDEMTSLGKDLRAKLAQNFIIDKIILKDQQVSNDKTIKCAFQVFDDEHRVFEGVLIPTANRMTACVSCQVGCSLNCAFCATGQLKLLRNLSAGEIIDQVVYLRKLAQEKYGQNLTNIVYMGMGEPMLNYKNVLHSISIVTSEKGLGMSPRRITVSTAGVTKMIRKLGDDQIKFNLAVSLHAANDKKRSQIMPINDTNNLEELADSLRYFYEKTGARVTYEYIIFDELNDSLEDAQELAEFAKIIPCKINIIEYNPVEGAGFKKAKPEKTDTFAAYLEAKNLIVNVRRSRGKDIDAACGQLANKNNAIRKDDRVLKVNNA